MLRAKHVCFVFGTKTEVSHVMQHEVTVPETAQTHYTFYFGFVFGCYIFRNVLLLPNFYPSILVTSYNEGSCCLEA